MFSLEAIQNHVVTLELLMDMVESWEGMAEQKRVMRSSHWAQQVEPLLVAGKRNPFLVFPSLAKLLVVEMAREQ